MNRSRSVVLYDGLCPVCSRLTLLVLRHDTAGQFSFAPLQSAYARNLLARHQASPPDPDTMYVALAAGTPSERLLTRADAVHHVLYTLSGPWRAVALVAGALPRALRNAAYSLVARNRYRFGRYQACALPRPEWRDRFIEVA